MNSINQPVKIQYQNHSFYTNQYQQKGPFILNIDNQQNRTIYKKSGEWTAKQNAKYALFILNNYELFQTKPHKLLWQEYKKMSKFISTRNFRQCKSHHQQLTLNFGTLSNILAFLKTNQSFQIIFQEQSRNLQKSTHKFPQISIRNKQKQQQYPQNQKQQTLKLPPQFLSKTSDQYQSQISLGTSIDCKSFQKYPSHLNKKQQWIQCHKLFIQWTTKLKQLMFGQF